MFVQLFLSRVPVEDDGRVMMLLFPNSVLGLIDVINKSCVCKLCGKCHNNT